jgi:hypothetical protein
MEAGHRGAFLHEAAQHIAYGVPPRLGGAGVHRAQPLDVLGDRDQHHAPVGTALDRTVAP